MRFRVASFVRKRRTLEVLFFKKRSLFQLETSVPETVGHTRYRLPLPHWYEPSAGCPAECKPSRPETNTVRPRSDN